MRLWRHDRLNQLTATDSSTYLPVPQWSLHVMNRITTDLHLRDWIWTNMIGELIEHQQSGRTNVDANVRPQCRHM